MEMELKFLHTSPFVVLPWKSLSPGSSLISHGCIPFTIVDDDKAFEPFTKVGFNYHEIFQFVSEVERISIQHLQEMERSLRKCHKWHLIVLGSGGIAAPILLPKIHEEGGKIYSAIGGRQPALFQSISGAAIAEAVRLGRAFLLLFLFPILFLFLHIFYLFPFPSCSSCASILLPPPQPDLILGHLRANNKETLCYCSRCNQWFLLSRSLSRHTNPS
jgi:hypothetical protein